MSDPPYGDDSPYENEREEREAWERVEEMEKEVEEDGGDPNDLYDYD